MDDALHKIPVATRPQCPRRLDSLRARLTLQPAPAKRQALPPRPFSAACEL